MIGQNVDYRESAKSYIKDYLYGVAEEIVNNKYGDTLKEKDREGMIDWENDGLVQFIKEKLEK